MSTPLKAIEHRIIKDIRHGLFVGLRIGVRTFNGSIERWAERQVL